MRHKAYIICALAALAVMPAGSVRSAGAEDAPRVTARVDKDSVSIGDRIKLDVSAEGTAGFDVIFPESPAHMEEFSLLGSKPVKRGWGKSAREGREYIMGIYSTGTHVVPPVQVQYRRTDGGAWKVVETPQIPVEVASVLTGEEKDIRDLKGLAVLGAGMAPFIALLAVALACAGFLLFRWIRKKRAQAAERAVIRTPYEIAFEQLMELKGKDLPGLGQVKEYYTELSDIIRHYLERRFSFKAPEMTTEEFMRALKISPGMLDDHKKLLKDFLSRCDMVKFAKYGPKPIEMLDSFNSAERLVEQTKEEEEVPGE